jgi:ABC-type transport system substrate-binding protein
MDGSIDILRPFTIDVPDLRLAARDTRFFGDIPIGMNFLHFGGLGASAPLFKDERVRRAVSIALDRGAILDTFASPAQLQNLGLPAEGRYHNAGVPAGLVKWWLDPESSAMGSGRRWYESDPKEARTLLSAAGVALETVIPFRYPRNGFGMAFNSIAESVASMLGEAGLRTTMQPEDYASGYLQHTQYGQFEGIAFSSAVPYMDVDSWLIAMLHSNSALNRSRPRDSRLDGLIEKQAAAATLAERTAIVHDIQRYASDRMYIVPTATGSAWNAVGPRVRNYEAYQSNSGNYAQATEHWMWLHLNT